MTADTGPGDDGAVKTGGKRSTIGAAAVVCVVAGAVAINDFLPRTSVPVGRSMGERTRR